MICSITLSKRKQHRNLSTQHGHKDFFLSFFAHLGVLLPTGHIIILMYSVFHIIGPPRLFQNKRGHIHDSPPTFFHLFVCFIWVLRMSTWTLILGAPMVNNMEYTVCVLLKEIILRSHSAHLVECSGECAAYDYL